MNFLKNSTACVVVAAMAAMVVSCNSKPEKAGGPVTPSAATHEMKIAYVDQDTLMSQYNLAKDINEAMIRNQNSFNSAQQQRGNEINKFGTQMQQKYKNNGYLSQESFNADQAKLQKMQNDAQNYLGKLQQSIESQMNQQQQQLLDSVNNYMKIYAKQKGYDVILYKQATFYIDPKYDVTKDVVDGLNKRYTKVSKK